MDRVIYEAKVEQLNELARSVLGFIPRDCSDELLDDMKQAELYIAVGGAYITLDKKFALEEGSANDSSIVSLKQLAEMTLDVLEDASEVDRSTITTMFVIVFTNEPISIETASELVDDHGIEAFKGLSHSYVDLVNFSMQSATTDQKTPLLR